MRFLLRMCEKCFVYTLNEKCKKCKIDTKSCHPAKFSPDDKYINYRIRDRYE